MKVTVTEPKPWKRVLEIEVPGEQVREKVDSVYSRYRKQITLPGFRRGKVPFDVLKAKFGSVIRAEVLEKMVPELYEQAQQEHKIVPISQPVIEDMDYEDGQPLRFRAAVEVKPPIDLKTYKGIRVLKKPVSVTDEDIRKALDDLRDRHADIERVEGAAERGHYLLADMQTLDHTGIPIIGRKAENQFIRIGSGRLGETFDEQLVGVQAGDERRITTAYPEDYEDENLAGREAKFLVTVREILEKKLPDLDDDFAVDVGAENLETLENAIREDLEQEPEREVRRQLIKQLVEDNTFEVPDSMLKTYLDRVIADARRNPGEPVNEGEIRRQYRPVAIDQIKRYLILEEIAEREQIGVSEEELDARLEKISRSNRVSVDQIKRIFKDDGRMDQIESEIKEEKTIEFLMEQADIQVG